MSKTQEAAHTQGPWEACGQYVRTARAADGSGGFLVAELPVNEPGMAERAQLIAAAPKMAQALKLVLAWYEAEDNHEGTTFQQRMDMCRESENAVREALALIAGAPATTEQSSAVAPSLALTAFIQDVEAAEGKEAA